MPAGEAAGIFWHPRGMHDAAMLLLASGRQFAAPECWNFYSYKGVYNYALYIKQYILW